LAIVWGLLHTGWGQNWLARQVTNKLSRDLQSRISIKRVDIGFFNYLNLEGVLVEDQKQDTLLSAGLVQVRITDWFFFKDKADLKYIGLENAVIKLQRTDSVWNYAYLEKYFASTSTDAPPKKKAGISFNLKQVALRNVYVLQKDAWIGRDMTVKIGGMYMDAKDISITNKIIDIPAIALKDPFFALHDYTGNRPDSLKPKAKPKVVTTSDSLQWNAAGWVVRIGNINLENGRFKNDKGNSEPYQHFDGSHIDFTAITGTIQNFRLGEDTILAKIDLSTKERSGLMVQSLKSNFRFHPKLMEFNQFYLKTNESVLEDYFAMKYADINSMNDFIHAVTMEAHFDRASISSDDLAFFAPVVKSWKRNIIVNGDARGTVDDLTGKNLTVQIGQNTYINGDVTMIGLPDINSTYINLKANDLRTTYNDAVQLIPAIRNITTPDLRSLSYLRFKGNYTGFLSDFVTYGTLQTNLGTLVTDLNMKLPAKGIPVYSGKVSTTGFQLGKFIRNPELGLVAFNGNVKGKGFKWDNNLDVTINGVIQRIQYNDYNYQNITAKGQLKNRMFNGDFLMKDPNADLHIVGLIDLRGKQPLFNANADIEYANLKVLQLSNDDLVLKGKFDVDFSGRSLSEFLGTARIYNAELLQNGSPLSFDSLVVSSQYINGVKTLRATSNELDATITGNFNLETLPDAFLLFLNRYYPSYIKPPSRTVKPQSFAFDIKTGVIENYIKLIDKRLSGFNNSTIVGSLDVANNLLTVQADVPQFSYSQYQFSDVIVKGDGNLQRLKVEGQVNNTIITDSLRLPQTTFSIEAKNDISDISIATTANQTINQANLSAQLHTFSNGFSLSLNPSSFVLNGKTWNIEQGGELDFRRNTVVNGLVVIRESNQEIRLSTQPSDIGNWNDLVVTMSNLNLGDITPIFVKSNRIEGLLSGDIHIEDPQNRFNVTTNLRTDQLRLDNDSIGQVQTSLHYNNQTGLLSGGGNTLNPDQKLLFDLALDFKDSANTHRDRITIQPVNYPVKILERFIGNLFSDLQGNVTGKLDILGEGADRVYIGKATLRNASLKVDFTQVYYTIEDTEIELKEDGIYFGTIRLHDRFGNTAILEGHINHKGFSNMYFDILAQVESRQMELLNTSYNDNQQFYGRAMGSGTFILVGEQNDMIMDIRANASETDSSYITLPPSRTRESGQANFMVEKKYGREMTANELGGNLTNISYTVNLNANPLVNMEVVLDELTGDIIRGRGTGNLFISSGTNEPLSIRGRYEIEEGSYLFTFQSFFKKPFTLRPGGNNYIDWTGDPYGATIHFDAMYTAERVSFAPLAGDNGVFGGANKNYANIREDVNVVATLTGALFHPTFNFRLEFPQNSEAANDPTIAFGIQQIEKNENELNKQVTYLIVFNSFAPYEAAQFTTGTALNEFAYSTISGLFFGEVNKRLNQLLSKVLRNNDLTFNFTGSLYNRNLIDQGAKGFNINQSNLNLSVGVPLFSDRFILTFGSTFDIPITSDIEQNIQFLPDVTAQWLINKSGSVRATFFYRQNLDFIGTSTATGTGLVTTRTGANISYRKEFDHFGKPKGKLKDKPANKPANDSTTVPVTDSTAIPATEDSTQVNK
jgi:hypothetical protein